MTNPITEDQIEAADKPVTLAQKALSFATFCRSSAFDVEDLEMVAKAFEQLAAALSASRAAETPASVEGARGEIPFEIYEAIRQAAEGAIYAGQMLAQARDSSRPMARQRAKDECVAAIWKAFDAIARP